MPDLVEEALVHVRLGLEIDENTMQALFTEIRTQAPLLLSPPVRRRQVNEVPPLGDLIEQIALIMPEN